MMTFRFRAVMALLLAAGAPAISAEPSDLAKRFGARESIRQISLSPDGTRVVAVLAGEGRARRAVVIPIGDTAKVRLLVADQGGDEQLSDCHWASDQRIICGFAITRGQGRTMSGFSRLLSMAPDGGDMKLLTANNRDAAYAMQYGGGIIDWLADGTGAGVLMTRQFVPTWSSATNMGDQRSGLAVERVDPITLKRVVVEPPRDEVGDYITDGHGDVRIMATYERGPSGYVSGHINYAYRPGGDRKWSPLSRVTMDSQTIIGFDPAAVDRDLNVAYGFDDKDGRRALYKVALDGSLKRELVASNPHVDIDGLVRIGRQHRVVGVSYATDRRVTEFFDPELKRLQASLAKALPDAPLISFIDASGDESRLLLWSGSDVDPGQYLVFDKKTHHLDSLAEVRPPLDDVKLSPVKAITFPAADGTPIPAYLTLPVSGAGKNLPAIVMPHGGPSDRDEWGFDWLVQFFAARGYAVLQPNYRGSSGYGAAWFQKNGFRSWKTAIGDVNDAGRWLAKQGIADSARLAIVGWSYGGYAALQSAVLDPDLYKAIIAIAPVTDLDALRAEHQNFSDYQMVDAFIGRGDHVREGSPAQNAGRIKAPVLLLHGDRDFNVGVGESRLMQARLKAAGKAVDYREFAGLSHQLDDGDARAELLDRSDRFLRAAMKM